MKKQHVDLVNGTCYGHLPVSQKRASAALCVHECRMKKECIAASQDHRDKGETWNTEYNESLGNPMEEEESSVASDFFHRILRRYARKITASGHHVSAEELDVLYPVFREVTSQFLYEFVHMPQKVTILAGEVVGSMSQAEVARRKHVTRQSINYHVKKEERMMMIEPHTITPKYLKGKERLVYQACFVDGCTERAAAEILRIPKTTIHRLRMAIKKKNETERTKKQPQKKVKADQPETNRQKNIKKIERKKTEK